VFTQPLRRNQLHNPVVLLLRAYNAGCLSSRCLGICWHVTILSLSLILRPTVSRPVCLGIKHPSGLTTRFFFRSEYGIRLTVTFLIPWVILSDESMGLSFVCAAGPCQRRSFLGPSPLVLATVFYCLRFETSHFVASYDSQGHGGGIPPRLHTGSQYCL
jgi:hypothetical protein